MNQVLHNVWFQAWLDCLKRDQVHFATEQFFQIKLCVHIAVKGGTPLELDEYVHIAIGASLSAGYRSKNGQRLDTQFFQFGTVPADARNYSSARHILIIQHVKGPTYSGGMMYEG